VSMKFVALCLLAATVAALPSVEQLHGASSNSSDSPCFSRGVHPIPTDEFEIGAYLGTWQTAWISRNQLRGCICQKGNYGVVEGQPDVIRVINTAVFPNTTIPFVLSGYATASPDSFTVLQVNNGATAPLKYFAPNYVVFGLGPKDQNGQYTWSAITSTDIKDLYLLVRDLDDFAKNYEDTALAYVKSFGFPFEGASTDKGVVERLPDPSACI